MGRKSIFYFMHIPWNWIKQRPHFIAERLHEKHDLEVFTWRYYGNKKLTDNQSLLPQHVFWRLPFNRLLLIRKINNLIVRLQARSFYKSFDIIWLTNPSYFDYLSDDAKRKSLIYDCMDDILEFPAIRNNQKMYKEYYVSEKKLLATAKLVLCSSQFLKQKLTERYALPDVSKMHVLNNGINVYSGAEKVVLPEAINTAYGKAGKVLTYIGTISHWLDFDLIFRTLEEFAELKIFLFGPAEITIPRHERLFHFGTVQHSVVFEIMKKAEVLIMPFEVNELIKAVNPVKAYEYIFSNKIVVMTAYGETEKFKEYVFLYNGYSSFKEYIDLYIHGKLKPKTSEEESRKFALDNTWEKRALNAIELIKEI